MSGRRVTGAPLRHEPRDRVEEPPAHDARETDMGRTTPSRAAAAGAALVVGLSGLAACGDSAGPEAGAVTTEDLQGLEEQVGALEERLGVLEEGSATSAGAADSAAGSATDNASGGGAALPAGQESPLFTDPASLVGQQVTVSAAVMEVLPTAQAGAAFTIGGQGEDEAIPVISVDGATQVQVDDVVQVSGTVVQVDQQQFQQDFGVAADELFSDAEAFFTDNAGDVALDAGQVQVLQEQAAQR